MPCSRYALAPARTKVKPSVEATACCDDLVGGAGDAGVGDADEGGLIRAGKKRHSIRVEDSPVDPIDENQSVRLDLDRPRLGREAIHVPVPRDGHPGLEPATAAGEPELRGDGRVHEGSEDLGDRAADEHRGLRDRNLGQDKRRVGQGGVLRIHAGWPCSSFRRRVMKRRSGSCTVRPRARSQEARASAVRPNRRHNSARAEWAR